MDQALTTTRDEDRAFLAKAMEKGNEKYTQSTHFFHALRGKRITF